MHKKNIEEIEKCLSAQILLKMVKIRNIWSDNLVTKCLWLLKDISFWLSQI